MKGMLLRAFGKPLAWDDVAEPKPGPHEALVEARAKALVLQGDQRLTALALSVSATMPATSVTLFATA
jgi:hypothetical protein